MSPSFSISNTYSTKSFCVAFTPKHYILSLSSLFMNSLPILYYTDSIKYLGFIFTNNNCDDTEMRMLYCRSNRLFNKGSNPVLL